jgi:GTP cyclohydrolase I
VNPTCGVLSIYTDLEADKKGTNMSRYRILVEEAVANKTHRIDELVDYLLDECKNRIGSQNAYIKVNFEYFLIKEAPVSKIKSHMSYKGSFAGKLVDGVKRFYLSANVLYASCCVCSKNISDYGAHNQQSFADVTVELDQIKDRNNLYWFEELVEAVEKSVSAPMWNALKRVDEAYVTELMYEQALFIEDCVRNISTVLDGELDKRIKDYLVVCEHFESIHQSQVCSVIHANRELK